MITGSHRSGTTWVGNMIAASPQIQYIPDTFAPNGSIRQNKLFDVWFKMVDPGNDRKYYQRLDSLFKYKFSLVEAFHLKSEQGNFDYRNTPARIKFLKDIYANKVLRNQKRPLLKDPIAIFSAEWLHGQFDTSNLILIRHPAAFVSSLKRMNWRFDFNNFLNQPLLMEKHLVNYRDQISRKNLPLIIEGALLWNCIHHVIRYYKRCFPGWIYKRHEDISIEPLKEFENIYSTLSLPFTASIKSAIISTTSGANPSEVVKSGQIHQLKRDSRANIKNWKKRLTNQEIATIRKITEPVASSFYTDEDW